MANYEYKSGQKIQPTYDPHVQQGALVLHLLPLHPLHLLHPPGARGRRARRHLLLRRLLHATRLAGRPARGGLAGGLQRAPAPLLPLLGEEVQVRRKEVEEGSGEEPTLVKMLQMR